MIVTLLTDFGLEDEYVGVMKGVILGINPSAVLVDLSHQVSPGDVVRAGWLLAWSWTYFSKGTVHVVVVDPGVGSKRQILCLEHKGHIFLGPDNGVLSQVAAGVRSPRFHAVTNRRYLLSPVSHTFHGRDIMAPAAGHLSKGLSPSRLGSPVREFKKLSSPPVVSSAGRLTGQVIGFDRFGNAVSNLPARHVLQFKRRKGMVRIRVKGHSVGGLRPSYTSVSPGSPLAIIGSHDLLEIAVNQGSACRKLRLKIGDPVDVRA